MVCHTFPPLIGGSAGVYAALAHHAEGAIVILTSRLDTSGLEQEGWRAADAALPYSVLRIGLVRPPLARGKHRSALLRRLSWAVRAVRLAAIVAAEARRHGVAAVCICDDESVGWLVPFARRMLGLRALIYCHGDDLVQRSARERHARMRWFRAADGIIAAGAFAARRLVEGYGVAEDRITIISNGVDLQQFRPLPACPSRLAALGLEGRRIIVAPSRLVARKGIDRLIAAMPAIIENHPQALLLVIGDGPQREDLVALARSAGVAEAVRFMGAVAVSEMPHYYALAELMAVPNRAEPGEIDGVPLVFLEANACGLPVVGGLAGGTPEAVQHERNGLLVDGRDQAAIAAAINRILGDPALAARLSEAGLKAAGAASWRERTAAFLALCRPPP